jgi:hypothetical protein
VGFQAQALGFQGEGAAAGEGIVEGGQAFRIEEPVELSVASRSGARACLGAGAAPGGPDLLAGLPQEGFVGGVLPLHQFLDEAEEALPLLFLGLLGREEIGPGTGVVHHLGEDDGAGGRERAAGPPEVERGGVAVADGLLARRGHVDRLQRQGDFDQLLTMGHGGSAGASSSLRRAA